ncbi:MAG: hypothetical protein Q7R93_05060 [bacterium]|nr:hypothetical protein [bacterium]
MKIEKRVYKVFYQGKHYALPLSVCTGVESREKVLVRRKKKS